MSEIYGVLWVNSYGKKPIKIWVKALEKFDDTQIKTGLAKCLERKDQYGRIDKYPPNLAEFVQICRPEKVPVYHKTYKALPKPKANPELAKSELEKMRKFLKAA